MCGIWTVSGKGGGWWHLMLEVRVFCSGLGGGELTGKLWWWAAIPGWYCGLVVWLREREKGRAVWGLTGI